MSWRNTLLLALVVAAVGLVAYRDVVDEDPNAGWEAVFDEPQPTVPADDIERLLDLDPGSVTAVAVEYKGRTARSERTAYGWSGTTKPRALNDFIKALSELAIILSIDEEPSAEDLDGYGLLAPTARVTVDRDRQPPISIDFGRHNPSATGVYARVSRRPGVTLTGAVALWDLQKAVTALAEE